MHRYGYTENTGLSTLYLCTEKHGYNEQLHASGSEDARADNSSATFWRHA